MRPQRSGINGWTTVLGTLSGNAFLILGTLLCATVAILVGWVPPRGNVVFGVARLWSRGVLLSSGVRAEASFAQPLDPRERYVFMANHQSLFDIPALITTLPGQTRFLAKKSLFRIPFFGWAIRVGGFITIDRKDLSSARTSFSAAVARLRAGTSVLVFPEGTRSLVDGLLPFKRGGFLLAMKSGLSIVPIGIVGSGAVQRKGSFRIRPGVIRIHYGSPVDVASYPVSRKEELMDEVRRRIVSLTHGEVETRATGATGSPG